MDRGSVAVIRLFDVFDHPGQRYFLLCYSNEFGVNLNLERGRCFAKAGLEVQNTHGGTDNVDRENKSE